MDRLADQPEGATRGGHHAHGRAPGEQARDQSGRVEEASLRLVEQQRQRTIADAFDQRLEGVVCTDRDADGLTEDLHQLLTRLLGKPGQVDVRRARGVDPGRDLRQHPALPDSAEAHHRDQAAFADELEQAREVGVAADGATRGRRWTWSPTGARLVSSGHGLTTQHAQVQVLRFGARVDAELVAQGGAEPVVRGQRRGPAAAVHSSEHRELVAPLPERLVGDQRLGERRRLHHGVRAALVQEQLGEQLPRAGAKPGEAAPFGVRDAGRHVGIGEVTVPVGQRLAQAGHGGLRHRGLPGRGQPCGEPVRIDRQVCQAVPGRRRLHDLRPDVPTQPGDLRVHHRHGESVVLAPHLLQEDARVDGLAGPHHEGREQVTGPPATRPAGHPVRDHAQLAQDRTLHPVDPPRAVPTRPPPRCDRSVKGRPRRLLP